MDKRMSAKQALLPMLIFLIVFAAHYAWFVSTASPAESTSVCCSAPNHDPIGIMDYLKTQSFLFGYSIALSLSYACIAIRRFMQQRSSMAKNAALGGLSGSAILGLAGCYLTGCCGSPMLGIYIGLLGPTFLPFAKPLVAVITTASILFSARKLFSAQAKSGECCSGETLCTPTSVIVEKVNS